MGDVISKAANGIGDVVGNAFVAPIKTIFGGSCEGVCSGPWDVVCFIEHLCVSNLVKLLMILVLCYIILLFFYLMCKLGICQCIGRSMCKMCWAACEAYWYALEDITSFLCHKLSNTKRVNRRRRRGQLRHHQFHDIELGYSPSDDDGGDVSYNHSDLRDDRKHRTIRERKKTLRRHGSYRHHHHRGLKSGEATVRVKGKSQRRSRRHMRLRKVQSVRRVVHFKRKRFR